MHDQTIVAVTEASQVGEARRTATKMAQSAGLPDLRCAEVAIVATELATNLAKYAEQGQLFLQTLPSRGGSAAIELLAVDRGPGVADVERCLRDGFSSSGSPGTGLGAVRRLSSEFDIHSAPGAGTVVLSRIAAGPAGADATSFQWAALSTPAVNEVVCGDAWRIVERNGSIAAMVADGLGHGPLAAEAAVRAAGTFEECAFDDPGVFFDTAHRALTSSRGAAVAVGQAAAAGAMRYAGVGNISGSITQPADSRGLMSHNGTVGGHMRKSPVLDYPWPDRALLIMHSDGMSARWTLSSYDGLHARHPAIVAAVLHRDHTRGRDDSTIIVIRRSAPPAERLS